MNRNFRTCLIGEQQFFERASGRGLEPAPLVGRHQHSRLAPALGHHLWTLGQTLLQELAEPSLGVRTGQVCIASPPFLTGPATSLTPGASQRSRSDRDRKASRDLNRLLDKPGSVVRMPWKWLFSYTGKAFDDGKLPSRVIGAATAALRRRTNPFGQPGPLIPADSSLGAAVAVPTTGASIGRRMGG